MITLLVFLFSLAIYAGEEGQTRRISNSAQVQLPRCVDSKTDIDSVLNTMRNNLKNDHKYDGYKRVLSDSSDNELALRLIYAETLAANCPSENAQIAPVIAEVIKNRIARKRSTQEVVYALDQFASSLNSYDEAHFREFLCPKNIAVWEIATTEFQRVEARMPSNTMHYYLFRHAPRFRIPSWAKGPKAYPAVNLAISEGENPCIRAYINPAWPRG